MLEMLRRTRSTFRLDEEACEEYQGRCYNTYMEDPQPRRTIREQTGTLPKPKTTASEPKTAAPELKTALPEPKTKGTVPSDPKSNFKPVEVNPVGLGILIVHGGRESKVCKKPILIQTPSKKATCLSPNIHNYVTCPVPKNPPSSFLKECHLCGKKLRPDKDIYMYRGELGFCTIECRSRQIFLDEMEEREKSVKAKSALAPRCRRRSVQIPQADRRRGVLAMA